jgi:hypothetical protein
LNTVLIAGLSLVLIYVGKQWIDARSEIAELRNTVAALKRRLKANTR